MFVALLLTMGFALLLINFGLFVRTGHDHLDTVITPTTDSVLASWTAYCAVLLVFGAKRVFANFAVRGWKRVIYWVIAFYVSASLPGHVRYIFSGDQRYFRLFPWWFSPVIMGFYLLFIAFMLTLQPIKGSGGEAEGVVVRGRGAAARGEDEAAR